MAAVLPLDPGAATGRQAQSRRAPKRQGFSFGKYREIIIAVALFLLFDLGVLVLNFYTSFKIDQDTVAINLAGRQRYVSQRIARTLLEMDAARIADKPVFLEAVTSPRGRQLEDLVETLWRPYYERLQPLMADGFSPAQLADVLAYSQANNIRLLNTANDFVTETQALG